MVLKLADFNVKPLLSLTDFPKEGSRKYALSTAMVSPVAATATLVDQDQSIDKFRLVRDQLTTSEGRKQFSLDQQARGGMLIEGALDGFGDILTNQDLSVEEKGAFVQSLQGTTPTWSPSTMTTLAENALIADNGNEETEQSMESRNSLAEAVSEVIASKREMASMINALRLERTQSNMETAVDLGELFLPFQEWIYYSRLTESLPEDQRTVMLGNQKEKFFEILNQVPVGERAKLFEGLLKIMSEEDNGQLVLPDGNDIILFDTLEHMAGVQDYSDHNKFADTAFGLLDVLGVGAAFRSADNVLKARMLDTVNQTNPATASQILKDTNPTTAREVNAMVAEDATNESAEALYGTTKSEALANDFLPVPEVTEKAIPNKTTLSAPQFGEEEALRQARLSSGFSQYSLGELESAYQGTIYRLENVEGMVPHKESLSLKLEEDGTTTYSMMYRPVDNGFKSVDTALNNAKFAFRNFGLQDGDFTFYARKGDAWIETTIEDINQQKALRDKYVSEKKKIPSELKTIDYSIGIKNNFRPTPKDIENWDFLDVKRNLFDALPNSPWVKAGQGSVSQHLFPPDSMLHNQITLPMNMAYDKSVYLRKLYVDTFKGFTDGYKKLPTDRRGRVSDYIHEANFKGIKYNAADLRARGFTTKEIDILRDWRKSNDALYHATNQDMIVSLQSKNYELFTDANGSSLVARRVARNQLDKQDILDTSTNTVSQFTPAQLTQAYASNQFVAKLSQPIKVGNKWVDHIFVPNTPNGYMRALTQRDTVLNYRDGYYPVMYDANFFVYEKIKMPNGSDGQKVVASARTIEEARKYTADLSASQPNKKFDFRDDRKNNRGEPLSEDAWSLVTSSSLSNQRYRGDRLADAGSNMHLAGMSNLVDPLEAVSNQIYKLSERIAVRPHLETLKTRWMNNYGKFLELPLVNHKPAFPGDISEITKLTNAPAKMLRDARTTFNYIHHLENGFINTIDNGTKALMNWGADVMGEMGLGKTELALRNLGKGSPTSALKGLTFKLFLASNAPRQLLIQAHQAVQLAPVAPRYLLTGGLSYDLFKLNATARGLIKDADAVEMLDELRKSGFLEAVDANNLIRQDKLVMAELSNLKRLGSGLGAPLRLAQKLGFDQGERFVLVTSWLAHRNAAMSALKKGQKLTKRDYELIAGKARAYTYAMNKAGDMPYNKNTLNVVSQFLQVPHKAILQPFTNRTLTRTQRAQLLAFNTVMYGIPTGLVGGLIYKNVAPGVQRDVLEQGLEDVLLNHVLTAVSGEEQSIDFGDFAPTDVVGTGQFLAALATLDIGQLVSEAPSTSLFFGNNPRVTNMFSTAARYFHLKDDYEDPELDTKFSDVVLAAANLFSGFSNTFKAKYAYETGTKLNASGNTSDSDVSRVEAVFSFFGFRTHTETGISKSKELAYGKSTYEPSDVDAWYSQLKQHLARRGQPVAQDNMEQRVLAEAWRVFGLEEQQARKRLLNLIQKDVDRNEYTFLTDLRAKIGLMDNETLMGAIEALPENSFKEALRYDLQRLMDTQDLIREERKKQ